MHLPVLVDGHHPYDRRAGYRPSCCLCTNMWITCAQRRRACAYEWKCWGFRCLAATMTGAFTWESASHTLCMQRKPELSTRHAAIDN
jgi:hypothetical protein